MGAKTLKKKKKSRITKYSKKGLRHRKKVAKKQMGGDSLRKGGVFCYMPYKSLDKSNKSTFKIDSALDISKYHEELKKFFPSGFYVIALLLSPNVGVNAIKNLELYYKLIKDHIIDMILANGGKSNKDFEGGWVYCSEKMIHSAFREASNEYGGEAKEFGLTGRRTDTFEFVDVKQTENPEYVGKVVFHT